VTQVVVQTPAPPAPPADFNLIAMQLTDIVAAVLVFAGVMLVARWLLRSPIAEAIGARIRAARGGEAVSGEHEDRVARLEAEVSSLRHELTEYAERLDFAERLLAERRRDKLGAGS
jgi:hypothetical protein